MCLTGSVWSEYAGAEASVYTPNPGALAYHVTPGVDELHGLIHE